MITKLDGFDGNVTDQYRPATLWLTEAVTAGDWIASDASDTSNPGAYVGGISGSFRLADSDEAEALYGTVGVAVATTTAAGYAQVYVRGRVTANVTDGVSVGADVIIGATPGRAVVYADGNTNVRILGKVLVAPSSNLAMVEINPHPWFIAT